MNIDFEKIDLVKSELFKKMKEFDINLQVHYIPVHLQPYYQKKYGFKKGDFEVAEDFYDKVLSIPIYPLLEDDQVEELSLYSFYW